MAERIQKILASQGVGSRRQIEKWISEGRIVVNGMPATLGQTLAPGDKVIVNGKPLETTDEQAAFDRVVIYHKPEGEVCSRTDPEGRPVVFDNLPRLKQGRWIMVGRLDINTSGLLLFTTNGELANRLMHPSHEIERVYACRILGEVTPDILGNITRGVVLDDGLAKFEQVVDGGGTGANHWYHVLLREGRKREVRRLWESQGVQVSRLIRTRYAQVELPKSLPRGRWMELPNEQAMQLAERVDMRLNLFEVKGQVKHQRQVRTPRTARVVQRKKPVRGSSRRDY